MNPLSPVRWGPLIALSGALLAVAVYLQALEFPFVSDDIAQITENTKLLELPAGELWRLLVEPFIPPREFLPLRELSLWLDARLFGLNPVAFRIHNIALFLICLPLVYAVTRTLWRQFRPGDADSAPWAAGCVTALFALHPALVESVVWITGRKYVLPSLLAMLALWLALRARRDDGLSPPHAMATLIAFVAVMLSKSSYVAIAPVIAIVWLLHWFALPDRGRRWRVLVWPLAVMLLAAGLLIAFITVATGDGGVPYSVGIDSVTRPLAVLGWLTRLAITPEGRHLYYPVTEVPSFPWMVATGVITLGAVGAGALLFAKKRSLAGFALVLYFLICLPYLQILPFASPSMVQDRYLSLAVWPLLLAVVACAWRLKPPVRYALLALIALPWSYQTLVRTQDWRSIESLVEVDRQAFPGYFVPAAMKINVELLPRGLYRDADEIAKSIADPRARELIGQLVRGAYAVHLADKSKGEPLRAASALWDAGVTLKRHAPASVPLSPFYFILLLSRDSLNEQWLALAGRFPDIGPIRYNAGLWLLRAGAYAEAATQLRAATAAADLPPEIRGTAFKNLGLALLGNGRDADAEAALRLALAQTPPDARAHCALAKIYRKRGHADDADHADASCRQARPGKADTE